MKSLKEKIMESFNRISPKDSWHMGYYRAKNEDLKFLEEAAKEIESKASKGSPPFSEFSGWIMIEDIKEILGKFDDKDREKP